MEICNNLEVEHFHHRYHHNKKKMADVPWRLIMYSFILGHHIFVGIFAFWSLYFKNSTNSHLIFICKYQYRFLTIWNLWIQCLYSIASILYCLQYQFVKNNKYLTKFIPPAKSYILVSIMFPCATFVSFTFWTLYTIDVDLVFPKELDPLLPLWYNHCIHTNILILPIFELFHNKPTSNYILTFIMASVYYWIYDMTMLYTYFETSKWIYKIFEVLSWPLKILYMLFNYLLTVMAMHLATVAQAYIVKYKNNKST